MKPSSPLRNFLLAAGSSLIAVSSASAQTNYFWDLNGATAGTGGTGTWNATDNFWRTVSDTGVLGTWNSGDTSIAIFGGTAGTVTLGTAITTGGLTFNTSGYTITGNTLTLAGGSTPIINATTGTSTISSIIAGTNGLQKNGGGSLVLSNASNSFSGGITLNGGTLSYGANGHLGDAANAISVTGNSTLAWTGAATTQARAIDIAPGATLSINGVSSSGYSRALTGSGTLTNAGSSQPYIFSSTNNTFTGTVNAAYGMTFASLGDGGTYNFGNSSVGLTWTGGAQTFANRVFTMNNTLNAPIFSSGTGALTIQQNLAISGTAGARTLQLGGTNTTSTNVFSGNIADGVGSAVSLTRLGGNSIWALSGTNTYTGATTFSPGGSGDDAGLLIFRGMQALPSSTSLNIAQGGSNQRWGTIRLLDDSATPTSRSGVNLNFSNTEGVGTGDLRHWMRVFVGNNSTANGGTSASTQTGSTIQLGNLNLSEGATASTGQGLWVSGANGYRLQIANVNVTLQAGTAGNHIATLRADNPMTITGTVRQANDATAGSNTTLALEGSATSSLISGAIRNSAGGRLMNVTKGGTGSWSLSGTNDYTGTTSVSNGILRINGDSSLATGAVSVTAGALGGNGGSLGGAVTVSSTGGLDLRDSAIGNLTLGSTLNITGAAGANNLRFDMGNGTGTSDALIVAGATTLTNNQLIDLNWLGGTSGRTAGTYTLIGGAGALDATNFGRLLIPTTKAYGQTYTLVHDTVSDGGTGNLQLSVTNVTGAAGNVTLQNSNPSWTSTANFNSTNLPDYQSNVTIASNIGTTGALNASQNINSLNYTSAATTGTTITPGTATANTSSNMLVIEAAAINGNIAGRGITLSNTSGTHTISANIGLASSQTWSIAGSTGGLSVSGVISDFGLGYGLTKAGAGTLTLSTNPTYTGATVMNGGTLNIASLGATALSSTSGIEFISNSTIVLAITNQTTPSMTINNGVTANVRGGTTGSAPTYTIPSLSGSGTFSADHPGGTGQGKTFAFTNLSNFTGLLQMNLTGASTNFDVSNLNDTVANNIRFAGNGGVVNSPNRFRYVGSAGLTLTNRAIEFANGANAFLSIENNGTNNSNLTINSNLAVTNTGNKTLQFSGTNTGGTSTFAGTVNDGTSAVISLTKINGTTWNLTNANNTFSGAINIGLTNPDTRAANNGTLNYASAGGGNSITFNLTTGSATLTYAGSTSKSMSGAINASTLTTGTITLGSSGSGAVNYSNTASLGSAASGIKNLILTGTNAGNNILAGGWNNNTGAAATVTKSGTGTWILSGTNNYTGLTTVNAGSLQFAKQASLYNNTSASWTATNINVKSGGTLAFNVGGTGEFTTGNVTTLLTNLAASSSATNGMNAGSQLGFDTTNATGGTFTISDVIANSTGGSGGARGLTKFGTGTLVLSNTNTYTGVTTLSNGILSLGTIGNGGVAGNLGQASNSAVNIVFDGGTLQYTGASATSDRAFTINTGKAATIETTNNISFAGATGTATNGGLTKTGAGTLTLTGTNTYTGATNVNAGILNVSSTGNINSTASLNVAAGGTVRYNSSTALTVAPTLAGNGASNRAVLGGAGSIGAAVTLDDLGDVLSPGNSPGIQTYTTAQTWSSFTYDWEVNDFTGLTAGTAFDQLNLTTLDLTGGSGSYVLNVLGLTADNASGLVPNFSEISRSWTILTTSGGISNFDAANWAINTTGFTDPHTGNWSLAQTGNDLVLSYTVIPEPKAALLGGIGLLLLLRRRR